MLNKTTIEEILTAALSTGGDFAEIFIEDTYTNNIVMLGGSLNEGMTGKEFGIGIRVLDGLRNTYAFTNNFSKEALMAMAKKAAAAIKNDRRAAAINVASKQLINNHPAKLHPSKTEMKRKLDIMKRAHVAAKSYDELISQTTIRYIDQEQHVLIANSDGLFVEDTRIKTRLNISSAAEKNGEVETAYTGPGAAMGIEFYDDLDIEYYAKESARMAKTMLEADHVPSGQMPVIVENGFGGIMIHEACGHSLEASFVAKGNSQFSNMIGEKIASDEVTLIDDGSMTNEWGSLGVDDEGNATRKNTLIEDGVLKSYMVDKLNGRRMGMEPTGSARRQSYRFAPTSRMTNTYIADGSHSREDIISNTEYGFYASHMDGGSVNPVTGDYNFTVVEGYMIKDGKIDKPVKGATLIGNGAETLRDIDMVANNSELGQGFCYASSGTLFITAGQPTVRIKSITVGGKGEEN